MTSEQTLLPIGRRDSCTSVNVSLRGSLANQYYELLNQSKDAATSFIDRLLGSDDIDIVRYIEDEAIVIGRQSELGYYFPDW